jgi:hypothetical protein
MSVFLCFSGGFQEITVTYKPIIGLSVFTCGPNLALNWPSLWAIPEPLLALKVPNDKSPDTADNIRAKIGPSIDLFKGHLWPVNH